MADRSMARRRGGAGDWVVGMDDISARNVNGGWRRPSCPLGLAAQMIAQSVNVLVAAARQADDDDGAWLEAAAAISGSAASAWALSSAGNDALGAAEQCANGVQRLVVGDGSGSAARPTVVARSCARARRRGSPARPRSSGPSWIWPSSSCSTYDVSAVQHADLAVRERARRGSPVSIPSPAGLDADQNFTPASSKNGAEQPDGVASRRRRRPRARRAAGPPSPASARAPRGR